MALPAQLLVHIIFYFLNFWFCCSGILSLFLLFLAFLVLLTHLLGILSITFLFLLFYFIGLVLVSPLSKTVPYGSCFFPFSYGSLWFLFLLKASKEAQQFFPLAV